MLSVNAAAVTVAPKRRALLQAAAAPNCVTDMGSIPIEELQMVCSQVEMGNSNVLLAISDPKCGNDYQTCGIKYVNLNVDLEQCTGLSGTGTPSQCSNNSSDTVTIAALGGTDSSGEKYSIEADYNCARGSWSTTAVAVHQVCSSPGGVALAPTSGDVVSAPSPDSMESPSPDATNSPSPDPMESPSPDVMDSPSPSPSPEKGKRKSESPSPDAIDSLPPAK